MKRYLIPIAATWTLFVIGCGSGTQQDVQEPDDTTPAELASDIDEPGEEKPYLAPAHVFTSRSHPPHHATPAPPPPNLRTLPRLKMRFNQCFGSERRETRPLSIAAGGGQVRGTSAKSSPRKHKRPESGSVQPSMAAPLAAMDMAEGESGQPMPPPEKASLTDDADVVQIASEDNMQSDYEDWGAAIYLSNDDTMSLSSAQRVIFAIDNFLPLPAKHIRPHELLNYFSFSTVAVNPENDFSVLADIAEDPREEGIYSLALSVRGRPVDKQSRRNGAITLVIDRSGSMHSEGRMSYLKLGLKRMLSELKTGDIINIVLFDHQLCSPVENFVVGRDHHRDLERVINALEPRGSTDLHLGLTEGYRIADKAYRGNYSNRVVLITDALTNTGVVDQEMISTISKYYDARRIRLSGVGVGRDFNDALLDRLTEKGKGAYVFLGSEAEVDAVFGPRFISLIETTALDVHFKLHLPPSLRMNVFYGEESSTVKEDVQEIHYFANTSQLFLSDLMVRGGELRSQDWVMMSIEYEDPETGKEREEEYAFSLGDISGVSHNVKKARLIMTFIDMLAQMAARPVSHHKYRNTAGSWQDPDGWTLCQDGGEALTHLAQGIADDGEVQRVLELWTKYCARYERPRQPVKRQIIPGDDTWPGAAPKEPR